MTFKDILPEDNLAMLDLDEFGEFVEINGVLIRAVIQASTDDKSGNDKKNFKGLFGDFIDVYFRTEDYRNKKKTLPHNGETCHIYSREFDITKRFIVEVATDEMGMFHMTLAAYRQYKVNSYGN